MPKPIICPECIALYEKEQAKQDETGESQEEIVETDDNKPKENIKVFNDWKTYAAHILSEHPESDRVSWVISSVDATIEKYMEAKAKVPDSIWKLKDMIDKGTTLVISTEEKEETTEPIVFQDADTWKDKLTELHGIEIEEQKKRTQPKPKRRNLLWLCVAIFLGFVSYAAFSYKANIIDWVFACIGVASLFMFIRKPKTKA